jgi:hypothetical protein
VCPQRSRAKAEDKRFTRTSLSDVAAKGTTQFQDNSELMEVGMDTADSVNIESETKEDPNTAPQREDQPLTRG